MRAMASLAACKTVCTFTEDSLSTDIVDSGSFATDAGLWMVENEAFEIVKMVFKH